MTAPTSAILKPSGHFPELEVLQSLEAAIDSLDFGLAELREPWEPMIDSLEVAAVFVQVERVLPGMNFRLDKLVRCGGYMTKKEALQDILLRLRREWDLQHKGVGE